MKETIIITVIVGEDIHTEDFNRAMETILGLIDEVELVSIDTFIQPIDLSGDA
jgi:hypothetical protein